MGTTRQCHNWFELTSNHILSLLWTAVITADYQLWFTDMVMMMTAIICWLHTLMLFSHNVYLISCTKLLLKSSFHVSWQKLYHTERIPHPFNLRTQRFWLHVQILMPFIRTRRGEAKGSRRQDNKRRQQKARADNKTTVPRCVKISELTDGIRYSRPTTITIWQW